jgi:hypothetical protein
MNHLKLFEEFNPYTGKRFAEKLRLYCLASQVCKRVTPIRQIDKNLIFDMITNTPGDYNSGKKSFEVIIPTDIVSKARILTFENGKKVLDVNLEPDGENDINNILMNFIEAANLYDDSSITAIVDAYSKINSPEDIKKIIANGQ